MSYLNAIIQGIIQGLTEFLPVSSSGHLSIIQYFTGQNSDAGAMFSIALHLGTLIAVICAFHKTIFKLIAEFIIMVVDLFTGKFSTKHLSPYRRMVLMLIVSLLPLVLVVFLKDFYESFSTDNDIIMEGIFLMITGILLFISSKCVTGHKKAANMTAKDALIIGTAQAIAPLPGISRSGSTISAGLLCGLEKEFAVSFSFIMGIPAVLGAVVLEIPDMATSTAIPLPVMLTGIIVSAIFGLLAIKLVKLLIKNNSFKYFSYYTLIVGAIVIVLGIVELATGHAIQKMFM